MAQRAARLARRERRRGCQETTTGLLAEAAAAAQDRSHTLSPVSEPAVAQPDVDALRALQRETVETAAAAAAAAAGEAGELDVALERGATVVCNEIHRLQWQLFERVHALRARTRLVRAESVSAPTQGLNLSYLHLNTLGRLALARTCMREHLGRGASLGETRGATEMQC
jgi:hypothetical protein